MKKEFFAKFLDISAITAGALNLAYLVFGIIQIIRFFTNISYFSDLFFILGLTVVALDVFLGIIILVYLFIKKQQRKSY